MINIYFRVVAGSFLLLIASFALSLVAAALKGPIEPVVVPKSPDEIRFVPEGGLDAFLRESERQALEELEARQLEISRSKNRHFIRGVMSQSWYVIWIPWVIAGGLLRIARWETLVYVAGPLAFLVLGVLEWHSALIMFGALVVVSTIKRAIRG